MLPNEPDIAAQFQVLLHHMGVRGDLGERLAAEIAAHVVSGVELSAPRVIDPDEAQMAREIFSGTATDESNNPIEACHHCGGIHVRVARLAADRQPCPRIKSLRRHEDGTLLEVSYWAPGRWEADVIFPHHVYSDEDGDEDE